MPNACWTKRCDDGSGKASYESACTSYTNSQTHHIPYTASLLLTSYINSRGEIWGVRCRYNKSCRWEGVGGWGGDSEEDSSSSKLCKMLHLHNRISRQKIARACFGSGLNAPSTHQFAYLQVPYTSKHKPCWQIHCEKHAKYISKSSLNQ